MAVMISPLYFVLLTSRVTSDPSGRVTVTVVESGLERYLQWSKYQLVSYEVLVGM